MSAALALVSDLTLPPPQELFKWEVSVVQPPVQSQSAVPFPPPVAPTLPEPHAVKTPAPTKPQPPRHEPVVQAMPPAQVPQPVQEVQRVQEDHAVQESQPVQTVQAVQHATQAQAPAVTRQIQEEARPSREVTQSVSRSDVPVGQESVERVTAQPGPTVRDHHVTSVPAATERSLVEDSQTPVETAQKVEQPVTARHTPAIQHRTVHHMSLQSTPAALPDYGWLAQALWANVDQRKRYPLEAKLNRWEGKVILRLTIEQRGTSVYLLDLALEESSGHAILDRHTQDMVRKAFPIEVKHALSQPQVQLHLPFSYSME